jgi:hypothetical protein
MENNAIEGGSMLPFAIISDKFKSVAPQGKSRFYPKVAFQIAMESFPQDFQVIILFGEIDCREGILVFVEKCRYEVCHVSHYVMCVNKPW